MDTSNNNIVIHNKKEKRKKFYLTQKQINDIKDKYKEVKYITYHILAFEYNVNEEIISYIIERLDK